MSSFNGSRARIEAVATCAEAGAGSRALAVSAARRALEAAGRGPEEIEMLVNAGVYRDENIIEQAMGPFIQRGLGANLSFPPARGAGTHRWLGADRRRQERERRAKSLSPGSERSLRDSGDETGVRGDSLGQALLYELEVRVEPRRRSQRLERAHGCRSPVCNATTPPPSSLNETRWKPARSNAAERSSGPGKRRMLAGRYV